MPIPFQMKWLQGAFYDKTSTDYYLSPAKLESDYSPVRFERELKVFRRFCKRGKVLDLGCSTGAFLFQLMQQFPNDYDVCGTDISGGPLDYAEKRGVAITRGDFLKQNFGTAQFDAITFWAVMEHLINPKAFLDKATALLNPSGYCFILVPNMQSLAVRILGAKYRYILPQHVNYFTCQTLRRLAGNEYKIHLPSLAHFNPLVILKDFRDNKPAADRAALLKKTTFLKENPLLKPVKLLYHVTEHILAPVFLNDNLLIVLQTSS